jgi:hypothetical protein
MSQSAIDKDAAELLPEAVVNAGEFVPFREQRLFRLPVAVWRLSASAALAFEGGFELSLPPSRLTLSVGHGLLADGWSASFYFVSLSVSAVRRNW